ncbi:MAG: tRNA threonylcarbamoyladenosine biosynthesis protein TsaB [Verrucomicrobiales bacterium]
MRWLVIENSTPQGGLAFGQGNEVRWTAPFVSGRTSGGELLEAMTDLPDQPEVVVVGIGPGSYSGLRMSLSAGHGLALAWGVSVVGLPSVLGLDWGGFVPERYSVIGDAGRRMGFLLTVQSGEVGALKLFPVEEKECQRCDEPLVATQAWKACPDLKVVPPIAAELGLAFAKDPERWLSQQIVEPIYVQGAVAQ